MEAGFSVIPLGTRGWMPQGGRQTICTWVRLAGADFLLDCGTGVSRLLQPELRASMGAGPVSIVFSHFHIDHFVGLSYLPGLFKGASRPVRLIGPGPGLVGPGLREACERLTSPPLFARHYSRFPFACEIVEVGAEGVEIDGVRIALAPQAHPGGSVTIRLGDAVCYATDLSPATEALPLAEGVELLIHEAWSLEAQAPDGPHCGLPEAIAHARRAGVPRLLPLHFKPDMPEADIQSMAAFSTPDLRLLVPEEGRPVPLAAG